ncbi:MAG: S8 family serine peptidase [Bacteroidota bacterium]
MRKFTFSFRNLWVAIFIAIIPLASTSQTVNKDYLDGAIHFKIKDDVHIRIKVNEDKTVDINQLSFLNRLANKYAIKQIQRPYDAFNDSKLLKIFIVYFDNIGKIDELVKELENVAIIEFAEKCPRRYPLWAPNDPYYTLNSTTGIGTINWAWHLDLINAEAAWDIQKGSNTVKVGLVDNAIWGEHPDLQIPSSKQYNGATQTAGSSAPPTTITQTQCADPNTCPSYEWSHGTHCAGNIAAINNNGVGVASLAGGNGTQASGVQLYAARADGGSGMYSNYITNGINWCVNQGCKVISLSLGGSTSSATEQTFFTSLFNNGVTVVAAAGNDGVTTLSYPAAYNNVISVASCDGDKKLSSFSQYGTWVDIAAPGGSQTASYATYGISQLSTTYVENSVVDYVFSGSGPLSGKYDVMQGTSMACPITASLCALMLSKNSTITPTQILSCLQSTDQALATGSNTISTGNGIINASAALGCVPSTSGITAMFTPSVTSGNAPLSVQFTNTSSGTPTPNSYTWAWADGTANTVVTTLAQQSHTFNNAGSYTVTLTASNGTASATHTATITVTSPSTGGCDTLHYPLVGTLTYYAASDANNAYYGYMLGTNGYGIAGNGEYFSSTETAGFTKVDKAIYTLAKASGSTGNITFSVLNSNGTTTAGSTSIALSSIVTAYGGQPGGSIIVDFVPDIAIPTGGMIIATSIPSGTNGDTLALCSNTDGDVTTGSAWELYSGTWSTIEADWNGTKISAAIFPIVCSGTVGSEETLGLNDVMVYPNPTNGEVNIAYGSNFSGNAIVRIYNNMGSLITENKYSETTNKISTISLNNVESGIYYVTILNNDKVVTKRISIFK